MPGIHHGFTVILGHPQLFSACVSWITPSFSGTSHVPEKPVSLRCSRFNARPSRREALLSVKLHTVKLGKDTALSRANLARRRTRRRGRSGGLRGWGWSHWGGRWEMEQEDQVRDGRWVMGKEDGLFVRRRTFSVQPEDTKIHKVCPDRSLSKVKAWQKG